MAERKAPNVAKTISCVADQLFSEVSRVYKESGTLSDDLLSALNLIFQSPLLPALDLVDRKSVTLLESPSGRKMYRVIGSKDTPYICFSSSNYCSCPSYKFSVLLKDEHLMCKHVLAVKLSEAMDTFKRQQISDKDISSVISRVE